MKTTVSDSVQSEMGSLDVMLAESGSADGLVERILGETLPGTIAGPGAASNVLHVAAVASVDGVRRVLRISEQTPRSPADYFLLNSTRAWADRVVTSGKILRDEPELSFELDGPSPRVTQALFAARRRRTEAPLNVGVLTSGAGLEENMPVWRTGAEFTLITSAEGASRSSDWAEQAGVAVLALNPVSPRAAVACSRGGNRVSVELGARSSVELYQTEADEPPLVDLLVLSEYAGAVPEAVLGERFLPGVELDRLYLPGPVTEIDDWRFRIWRRR